MAAITHVTVQLDADLKAEADALFADLGTDLPTAIGIFVRQCVRDEGIPFEISRKEYVPEPVLAVVEPEVLDMAETAAEEEDGYTKAVLFSDLEE